MYKQFKFVKASFILSGLSLNFCCCFSSHNMYIECSSWNSWQLLFWPSWSVLKAQSFHNRAEDGEHSDRGVSEHTFLFPLQSVRGGYSTFHLWYSSIRIAGIILCYLCKLRENCLYIVYSTALYQVCVCAPFSVSI